MSARRKSASRVGGESALAGPTESRDHVLLPSGPEDSAPDAARLEACTGSGESGSAMTKGFPPVRLQGTSGHTKRRPHFKARIAVLERLLDSSREDVETLVALRHELGFRKTKRVADLRVRVEEALSYRRALGDAPQSSEELDRRKVEKSAAVPRRAASATARSVPRPPPLSEADHPIPNEPGPDRLPIHRGEGEPVDPDSILAAWTTLEVLTPQPLPAIEDLRALGRTLVRLRDDPKPWKAAAFQRRGRERAVFWFLYLGELDLEAATRSLLELFPEKREDENERPRTKGTAPLAVTVLDHRGVPAEAKAALASFAWGYGKIRAKRLTDLAGFPQAETRYQREIERRLTHLDPDGEPLPVDAESVDRVIAWLVEDLNLPRDQVIQEATAVRVPVWSFGREAPEPELVNSFFIQDLTKVRHAVKSGDLGHGFRSYLMSARSRAREDVLRGPELMETTAAPGRMPLAQWPGRGRYPLVLMQQVAVNHAASELDQAGLVGVNGPPGTGKTTLLRDLVAKVVVDRSIAMVRFDDPRQAFSHAGTIRLGPAFGHLYQLDRTLLGHEIVVASTNNKAVENISREIPAVEAVADDFSPPLRYFGSIADCVAAGRSDEVIVPGRAWGLAAAVLGNKANRSAFLSSFWWHREYGLAAYLRAIVDGWNPETTVEGAESPAVARSEAAPRNEGEAQERWERARGRFLSALRGVRAIVETLEAGRNALRRRPEVESRLLRIEAALVASADDLAGAARAEEEAGGRLEVAERDERESVEDRTAVLQLRPGFLARWFRTSGYREWRQRMSGAVDRLERTRAARRAAEQLSVSTRAEAQRHRERAAKLDAELRELCRERQELDGALAAAREANGTDLPDDRFWRGNRIDLHRSSPWLGEKLQHARAQLFSAAFDLHKAFIDAAARPLRHNLATMVAVMNGRALSPAQEPARRSLWASLFLVVPVISTTFASVARLFAGIGREEIGWLLIDEAGQAAPQAAVGAMWRSRRIVAIGDPLQIPPVITLPSKLITSVCSEYSVPAEHWSAPATSVQTVADRASWFGTKLLRDEGEMWVGCPLRVHRRCDEPMFSISNQIAYNGLMVQATPESPSPLGEVLGSSRWIDVTGEGIGKWSPPEGRVALELLIRVLDGGVEEPDVFFISPFRVVAYNLRHSLGSDPRLARMLPGDPRSWARERVGTIHTFQGKEAEAVVLVLGAPNSESAGARWWAGSTPNLLNVAVSRAKRRIYVVGSRTAWKGVGVFRNLASMLPVAE